MENAKKPIGIFDSGLGGITALKAVREILPNEDIIYLGDSARLPYGDKTVEQIRQYVCTDVGFLVGKGIKAVLVACNTADSIGSTPASKLYRIPLVGVVEPAGKKALEETVNGKIGVLATSATVTNGAYESVIKTMSQTAEVYSVAASRLVPLIEQGKTGRDSIEIVEALESYLLPLRDKEIDTLILGCTHYPLLYDIIKEMMPGVSVICSGTESAKLMKEKLGELNLLNDSSSGGEVTYYVTGDTDSFGRLGSTFIGENISGVVKKAYI